MAEPDQLTSAKNGLALHDTPRGIAGSEEVHHIFGTVDPSVAGRAAPEGSLYSRTNGEQYAKTGPADTDWTLLPFAGSFVEPPGIIVGAAASGIPDSHIPSSATTYKWIVTVSDNVTSDYRASTVMAIYNGSSVTHSVANNLKIGSSVKRTIDVNLNVGTVELEVTNTGVNPVTVTVLRFPIVET